MDIQMSPLSARRASVGPADDPFKKYWWAILIGFVLTGAWLFAPVMESEVGSTRVDASSKPAVDPSSAVQSLDSADNPSGAAGGALDLTMDGLKRKSRADEESTSMLFQAPPESGAAAPGAPLGAASGAPTDAAAASAAAAAAGSLAQELKDAGKAKNAAGWGEKAQSGFSAAHLTGAGLAGMSGLSGGSSASAGGPGSMGAASSHASFGETVGLHDNGGNASGAGQARAAAAGPGPGVLKGQAEALKSSMGATFDGNKGAKAAPIAAGVSNAAASALAANDAAPANLKVNDPTLNSKKMTPPPVASQPPSSSNQMMQQMAIMAASALIGGLIPGVGGQMVMMMGMMLMQQQQAQAAAKSAASQQNTASQRTGM
jgi:hypothetical protein